MLSSEFPTIVETHTKRDCTTKEHEENCRKVLAIRPHLIVDVGFELISLAHTIWDEDQLGKVIGGCEMLLPPGESLLSGLQKLKFPLVKPGPLQLQALSRRLFPKIRDRRIAEEEPSGGGSFLGYLAGRIVVVCGYGHLGKSVALRAKALVGPHGRVIITPGSLGLSATAALEAANDGLEVRSFSDIVQDGDIFVTTARRKHALSVAHISRMKVGVILCNAGQFVDEIDVEGLRRIQVGKSVFISPKTSQLDEVVEEIRIRCNIPATKLIYLLRGGRSVLDLFSSNTGLGDSCSVGPEKSGSSYAAVAVSENSNVGGGSFEFSCAAYGLECLARASKVKGQSGVRQPGGVIVLGAEVENEIAQLHLNARGIDLDDDETFSTGKRVTKTSSKFPGRESDDSDYYDSDYCDSDYYWGSL